MKKVFLLVTLLVCFLFTLTVYADADTATAPFFCTDKGYVNDSNDGNNGSEAYCHTFLEYKTSVELNNYPYIYQILEDEVSSGSRQVIKYTVFVPDDDSISVNNIVISPSENLSGTRYLAFGVMVSGYFVPLQGDIYTCSYNTSAMRYSGGGPTDNLVGTQIKNLDTDYQPVSSYKSNVKSYLHLRSDITLEEYYGLITDGSLVADNADDFLPSRYGVLEVPQELTATFNATGVGNSLFTNDLTIAWSQTDENYKEWETDFLFYGKVKYRNSLLIFGEWHYTDNLFWRDDSTSCRRLSYKCNLGEYSLESAQVRQFIYDDLGYDSGYTTYVTYAEIFVRNKYNDGKNIYYSNWVKITIDSSGDIITTEDDRQQSAEEIVYDDDKNGDSGQDFSKNPPSGSVNPDSQYDGSQSNANESSGSILDSVSDGFGLLGDNGIVDMISDLFSYVPDFVWALIVTGIGVMIAVALVKIVAS